MIVMFAALGGVGQATRAGNYSVSIVEQRDITHNQISKEVLRRRKETTTESHQDERIHKFLKQRDPFGYGVVDSQEERYRKLLPDPEICSSADIKARSMSIYQDGENTNGK